MLYLFLKHTHSLSLLLSFHVHILSLSWTQMPKLFLFLSQTYTNSLFLSFVLRYIHSLSLFLSTYTNSLHHGKNTNTLSLSDVQPNENVWTTVHCSNHARRDRANRLTQSRPLHSLFKRLSLFLSFSLCVAHSRTHILCPFRGERRTEPPCTQASRTCTALASCRARSPSARRASPLLSTSLFLLGVTRVHSKWPTIDLASHWIKLSSSLLISSLQTSKTYQYSISVSCNSAHLNFSPTYFRIAFSICPLPASTSSFILSGHNVYYLLFAFHPSCYARQCWAQACAFTHQHTHTTLHSKTDSHNLSAHWNYFTH